MIVLATAFPLSRAEDDRVASASRGKDRVEIAMTINQALFAYQSLQLTTLEAMQYRPEHDDAEVIAFPKRHNARR